MKAKILVADQPEYEKYKQLMLPLLRLHGFVDIDCAAPQGEQFAPAASKALEEYDLIVNIVSPLEGGESYIKNMYAEGFGLPLEQNTKLKEELSAKFGATHGCENNLDELCSFPQGAHVIKNPNGPNCGFIMLAPKQAIAVLPHNFADFAVVLAEDFNLKLSKFTSKNISAKCVNCKNTTQPAVADMLAEAKKSSVAATFVQHQEEQLIFVASTGGGDVANAVQKLEQMQNLAPPVEATLPQGEDTFLQSLQTLSEKISAHADKENTEKVDLPVDTASPQALDPNLQKDDEAEAPVNTETAGHPLLPGENAEPVAEEAAKAKNKKITSWVTAIICIIFGIIGMASKDKIYMAQLQTVYGDLTLAEISAAEADFQQSGQTTTVVPNINYRQLIENATAGLPTKLARFVALNPNVETVLDFAGVDIPVWAEDTDAKTKGQNYIKVIGGGGENSPKNTVIYIQNMPTQQITFSEYSQLYFYKEYPYILLTDKNRETAYEIFAVVVYDPQNTKTDGFDVENYPVGNEGALENYLQSIAARTLICTGTVPDPEKDILTVVAEHSGLFEGSQILLFAQPASKIEVEKFQKSSYNENVLLPSRWYTEQPDEERPQVFYQFDLNPQPPVEEPKAEETKEPAKTEPQQTASPQSSSVAAVPTPESSVPPSSSEVSLPASSSEVSSSEESSGEESSEESSSEEPSSQPDDEDDDEDEYIPPANLNERLSVTVNGQVRTMEVRELVAQAVESETRGNLHAEALKAHVVATYSYIKYNNNLGISPSVGLKTSVSSAVYKAVDQVLGEGVYYNGKICNAVYHSVSRGSTTSAQAVWGSAIPYLVSVSSDYDYMSPYFAGSYSISADSLAARIKTVYGIDAYAYSSDPADWIAIDYSNMAPGDYVGTVEICGYTKSQGGSVKSGTAITGRSVREQLLSFAIKSHSFEVSVNGSNVTFSTEGYGHGVGMSQWGAHYLAVEEGYDYVDILTHYYQGTVVK